MRGKQVDIGSQVSDRVTSVVYKRLAAEEFVELLVLRDLRDETNANVDSIKLG